MRVLITGGAGFIGSHLADQLLAEGHEVRALDNLDPQVHPGGARPAYLDSQVELQVGDVRDADAVARALDGVDHVVHFAAAVGVGQSMYEIARYTELNTMATARFLERVVALSYPENGPSVRVMQKIGMTDDGEFEAYGRTMVRYVADASR